MEAKGPPVRSSARLKICIDQREEASFSTSSRIKINHNGHKNSRKFLKQNWASSGKLIKTVRSAIMVLARICFIDPTLVKKYIWVLVL